LPINVAVDAVQLIAGTPDLNAWHRVCELPLGTTPPAAAGNELVR
jgi:hypothetical protein